ncbi:MAG TPA: hypothetical protein VLL97_13035 [Acidobacteriota bacterium]|nr:hypothetical protein [Acidobacteriota bacterium]
MTLQNIGILVTLVLALLGWAYQLGRSDARLGRNEKDIAEIKARRDQNERDTRHEIKEGFDKVYAKLDALPCHNPRWHKENC